MDAEPTDAEFRAFIAHMAKAVAKRCLSRIEREAREELTRRRIGPDMTGNLMVIASQQLTELCGYRAGELKSGG